MKNKNRKVGIRLNLKAFREKLSEYCDLREETKKLEKRLERLDNQDEQVADVVQNGYKGHAVIRGYDYIRKHKIETLEKILQERHDKLLEEQTKIELFISSIKKSDLRRIFEYRYIDNMTWFEIAHEMKMNNEDVPRKRHDRYLEKNKEI